MDAALQAVFDAYPPIRGTKPFSYGTSGFRGPGETLIAIACRMGPLMALRCVAVGVGTCTGVCFTASHNPHADNGLKLIDTTGDMLPEDWEPHAEALANSETPVAYFRGLMGTLGVTEEHLRKATVNIGRDTRPTGVPMSVACTASIEAVGCRVVDYGVVTTPQLHFTVEKGFRGEPVGDYVEEAVAAFRVLFGPAAPTLRVIVDCSHGVGALRMATFADRLRDVLPIQMVNTDTATPSLLNEGCGADFVQKELRWPSGMAAVESPATHQVSIDGDADRIVFMAPGASPDAILLIDGDRILVLYAMYLRGLLEDAGLLAGTRFVVVQTAYANGGSTIYVRDVLGLPVTLVPTGVKHCHGAAKTGDVGIFFEANGHGTALFSDAFLARVKATGERGVKIIALSKLLSQVCGDAITDMLAAEVAMRAAGWSVADWLALYADLPSRQLKVTVPDPQRIKTCWDQTRVTSPAQLQDDIDAAVRPFAARGPARCFVRPSGTEPIVRVYAEAATREDCDALANEVKLLVSKHLT